MRTHKSLLASAIFPRARSPRERDLKNQAKIPFLAAFTAFASLSTTLASVPTNPINFLGVDHAHTCTDTADNRACDSQNMIGDIFGSASKRNGSRPFITQAISTNPINGLYYGSIDMGTYTVTAVIATTAYQILVATSEDTPVWRVLLSTLITPNQHFSFTNYRGKIVMTGDALTDPIYTYDLAKDSFTQLFKVNNSSDTMNYRAKYVLATKNYLTLAAVMDVKDLIGGALNGNTTYYGSMFAYSLFNNISSFTSARAINVNVADGQSITGMTFKGYSSANTILLYKPDSVNAIVYTILDLDNFEGDIKVSNVATGFGCISPMGPANIGPYDVVPTRDGIILYDGGRKARLNLVEEIKPIDTLVNSDYFRTIEYKTFKNTQLFYYPKKQWILWSFEDPQFQPHGVPNRVFVYDLKTGEWWPLKNWLAGSFAVMSDNLLYGDSSDGRVHRADVLTEVDDSRNELSLDTMDKSAGWTPEPTIDSSTVVEGTACLKMNLTSSNNFSSSMTKMGLFTFGEWNDGSEVSKDKDAFSFKMKVSSLTAISSVTLELQIGVTQQYFTNIESSVTYSSSDLLNLGLSAGSDGSTNFGEIIVPLSSFTIPTDWLSISSELAPFAKCLTVYGIQFLAYAVDKTSVSIDDLRIVGLGKKVNEAYYLSKQFNFGTVARKEFRQIILSMEKSAESSFSIDVFTDYGNFANRIEVAAEIPKEIFVCSYKGSTGIAKLSSVDFTLIDSTKMNSPLAHDYMNGEADEKNLFLFDKFSSQILMIDRSSLTASLFISSFGSLGSGATNYNTVNQMCRINDQLLVADTFNNRIGKLLVTKGILVWDGVFGDLGTGTTQFNLPSGIAADSSHVWILDDSNFRIVKLSLSTFGFVSERRIDSNTIGEGVLKVDGDFLYVAYHRVTSTPYFQDVILEKRTKGDMYLIQRKTLRPLGSVNLSTYTLSGDFAFLGRYLFIGFTKDLATTGTYYVQKILKNGFDVVSEYTSPKTQFSIIGYGKSYLPITKQIQKNLNAAESTYIQIKYYDSSPDNIFKLNNYSFAINALTFEE